MTLTSSSSLSLGFSSEVCLTKSGMRISSVARARKIKTLRMRTWAQPTSQLQSELHAGSCAGKALYSSEEVKDSREQQHFRGRDNRWKRVYAKEWRQCQRHFCPEALVAGEGEKRSIHQRNHVGDMQANGSAKPGPSREDCRLSRLLECGREKQPHRMEPLEKISAGQRKGWLHGEHRCLSEQGVTCHWVGEVEHWGKRENVCNSLTLQGCTSSKTSKCRCPESS